MAARLVFDGMSKPEMETDYIIKVVVVGEPFVGKSTILDVLSGQSSLGLGERGPTIGIDFFSLHGMGDPIQRTATALMNEGHDPRYVPTAYQLQIWDCAGQVRFRSIVKSYFRDSHVFILVFDVTNRESFEMIEYWIRELRHQMNADASVVFGLLGNKTDIEDERRVVGDEEAIALVQRCRLNFYFPVSAKKSINLRDAFSKALELVHQNVLQGKIKLRHRLDSPELIQLSSTTSTTVPRKDVTCGDCF